MANFPPLLQLTRLELGATDVDYAGLVAIGALTSLQRLSLTDCQVSGSSQGGIGRAFWRCDCVPATQACVTSCPWSQLARLQAASGMWFEEEGSIR